MKDTFENISTFEHRFWLQILGDHSRFIFEALAPVERQNIETASQFIQIFDRLMSQAHTEQTQQLAVIAEKEVLKLREFKLNLIKKHLLGKIKIHLSPTFINHMVNELEEYLRILKFLKEGQIPPVYHEVHYHKVWLLDAVGHAAAITANLDQVEKQIKKKSEKYRKHFEAFYLKAVEMAGYLRTNITEFPALTKMNLDVTMKMKVFQHFLQELEELELSAQALGTFAPLMADHMFREECYYLFKLAQATGAAYPECDPAKPRVE